MIAKVLDELLSAMSYYHSLQIIHRDLKPSNILVTHNGNNVKIIDFGLSDADSYEVLKQPAGTLRYAAPEQLQTSSVTDCRTDIFALGKILEYDFPRPYHWLAKKCAKENPKERPDNAAHIQAMLLRHRKLQSQLWWIIPVSIVSIVVILLIPEIKKTISSPTISKVQPAPQAPKTPMVEATLPSETCVTQSEANNSNQEIQLKRELEKRCISISIL